MEKHNEVFRTEVLENNMFDEYDKHIIRTHLSNFYIVFQLGWDAHEKETKGGFATISRCCGAATWHRPEDCPEKQTKPPQMFDDPNPILSENDEEDEEGF